MDTRRLWRTIGEAGRDAERHPTRGTARLAVSTLACAAFAAPIALPDAGRGSAPAPGAFILFGVSCPTVETCVAVGDQGVVALSHDGGGTWHIRPSGFLDNLYAVACSSARRCVAVGNTSIVATGDGGVSWHRRGATPPGVVALTCLDARRCIAVGGASIVATGDGGRTWRRRGATPPGMLALTCPTPLLCVGYGDVPLLTSHDEGARWIGPSRAPDATGVVAVSCPDARRCVAVGQGGLVIATADGGVTWEAIPSAVALGSSDARHCVAVGEDGSIARGPAGPIGGPWRVAYLAGGVPLLAVSCASALRCVALGIPDVERCVILATGDGGRTWRRRFAN